MTKIKIGDKVLNKFTNRVGVIVTIDDSAAQARCDNDPPTAFYSLDQFDAYSGSLNSGDEANLTPPVSHLAAGPVEHQAKHPSTWPTKGERGTSGDHGV
jgi:hypothetical protein